MKSLLIIVILIMAHFILQSEESKKDTIKNYTLGEVVVDSKKGAINFISPFVEIGEKNIKGLDADFIDEALVLGSGIRLPRNSRNEPFLYIRGFDQRQISIYWDGVPISAQYDGLIDISTFSANSIHKIKVSKGMPSVLYGSNTMGGAVNIISKEYRQGYHTNARAQGGMHNLDLSAGHGGASENYFWYAGVNYNKYNNYPLSGDFNQAANESGDERSGSERENMGLFLKFGSQILDNLEAALSMNIADAEKYAPAQIYTGNPRYWKFPEIKSGIYNLTYRYEPFEAVALRGNFYLLQYDNKLESYDDSTYSSQNRGYAFNSLFEESAYGGSMNLTLESGFLSPTNLSLLYKKDTHEQSNENNPAEEYSAETLSLVAEQGIEFSENFKFLAGAGFDIQNPTFAAGKPLRESAENFTGHAGLYWKLTNNFSIRGLVSKKGRFPTLKELYADILGNFVSNDSLADEGTMNFEAGFNYNKNNFDFSLTIFQSDIRDLIQVQNIENNIRMFDNIGKARFRGLEADLSMDMDLFKTVFSYTYLQAVDQSSDRTTDKIEYRPDHNFYAILYDDYESGFGWRSEFFYTGEQFTNDTDLRDWTTLEDYLVWNVRISQRVFNDFEIYLRCNNITDKNYESEYGYPQPGRIIFGGISASFDH